MNDAFNSQIHTFSAASARPIIAIGDVATLVDQAQTQRAKIAEVIEHVHPAAGGVEELLQALFATIMSVLDEESQALITRADHTGNADVRRLLYIAQVPTAAIVDETKTNTKSADALAHKRKPSAKRPRVGVDDRAR